jgi:hypothetical protein
MHQIPFTIHQMWLDPSTDTNSGPSSKYATSHYTISIQNINANFQYTFWNMQKVKELFNDPKLHRWKHFYFHQLNEHIEMCDFARYALLYIHGGIYIDCDFTALQPLDPLLGSHPESPSSTKNFRGVGVPASRDDQRSRSERSSVLKHNPFRGASRGDSGPFNGPFPEMLLTLDLRGWGSQLRESGMTGPAAIFNGFLGSRPGHYFWSELMDYIMYRYNKELPVLNTTGPIAVGEFAQRMYYSIDDHPEWYINNKLVNWRKLDGLDRNVQYLHSNHFDGTNWWMTAPMIHKFVTNYVRSSMTLTTVLIIILIIVIIVIILYVPSLAISYNIEDHIRQWIPTKLSSSGLWLVIGLMILIMGFATSYWALINSAKDPTSIPEWQSLSNVGIYVGMTGVIVALRSIRSFVVSSKI